MQNYEFHGNFWLSGLFGIEMESFRTTQDGKLALTPHPKAFEYKLTHPYITTDFSESQIEMITPPMPSVQLAIDFLETIQDTVAMELNNEFLWPQSLPPKLPDEDQIPIAQFGDKGKEATLYREFLAKKYGKKQQMFSGVHFNFSFDERLLKQLFLRQTDKPSFDDFKEKAYFKSVRQLLKNRWLYILLYGNSAVNDNFEQFECQPEKLNIDNYRLRLSIRNSCFGYKNLEELFPDYSSLKNYLFSLEQMIKQGKISSEKELYSPIRIKFKPNSDKISHIEIRFVDIDPKEKKGLSSIQLQFLHWLIVFGYLSKEETALNEEQQKIANTNHNIVSLFGQDKNLQILDKHRKNQHAWFKAKILIENMIKCFNTLNIKDDTYQSALYQSLHLTKKPNTRKVIQLINEVENKGYINFHIKKAMEYKNESIRNGFIFKGYEDLELSTQLILKEAVRRGIHFEILDRSDNFIRLSKNGNIQYIKQATKTSLDNYASILAMENKIVTKHILQEQNISVPGGRDYDEPEKALFDFPDFESKNIVIKPKQTNFGQGITIIKNNNNFETFKEAVELAFSFDNSILVENYIEGKEYRVFVINNDVVAILHRVPANVTGNGTQSIRDLVNEKNKDPLRGKGYKTPLEKINIGKEEENYIKTQGLDFDYIPKEEEIIYLRHISNISTGGDSLDFTDDIHPSYKEIAVKAAQALNVKITGLDMIIKDFNHVATDDNYSIIELNFNPAIHIHCYPYKGENRRLDAKILDALGF